MSGRHDTQKGALVVAEFLPQNCMRSVGKRITYLSLILSLAVFPRQLAIKEAIVADRNKESTADQPTPSLHFALGRGVFEPLLDV